MINKLLVGLGNPGNQYEQTRHNAGFMVIDQIASSLSLDVKENKFNGLYTSFIHKDNKVFLLKPQSYMNNSGQVVQAFVSYFKIDPQDILIFSDDLDLPVGTIRLKGQGRDGGQKGLRSIFTHLNTSQIARCKIGIGNNKLIPTPDYVLGRVEKELRPLFDQSLDQAAKAGQLWLDQGLLAAMNQYNGSLK